MKARSLENLAAEIQAGPVNANFDKEIPIMPAAKNRKCPLIQTPMPECYCYEMNSAQIPKAIQYCLNDYNSCEFYKRQLDNINNNNNNDSVIS